MQKLVILLAATFGAVVGWFAGGASPVVADVAMAVNQDVAWSEMPVMKPENRLEKK